jgi:hypothetical protein
MNSVIRSTIGASLTAAAMVATAASPDAGASACKAIHAVMIEQRVTEGCRVGHAFCFLGEVAGNHDMRGTTYFKADGSGSRPTTSPDFIPYSGPFEYVLGTGTIVTRETGVSNTTVGNPDSGAVTAFQKIVDATGEWAGATGYFFVSGFSRSGRVETTVSGEICFP